MGFVIINKAKKRTRPPTILEKIGDRFSKIISVNLVKGIKMLKEKVNAKEIADALEKGAIGDVVQHIPWDKSIEELIPAFNKLGDVTEIAEDLAYKALPIPMQDSLRTDLRNPGYKRIISNRFNEFLQDLSVDSQNAIQRIIQRSFTHAQRPRDAAKEVIQHIGLNDRQSIALMNFQMKLEMNQHSPERIQKLTDEYSKRLLKQRSVMIARTEIANANNQGQLMVWNEAQAQGFMNPETTYKIWETDRNPCDKICRPMKGKKVKLHEKWLMPNGKLADVPTDSHPHCYCFMQLEFE